jgi:GTP-binding protein
MSQLWQARFFTTVNHLRDLPGTHVPEIAFAGRSNAGKSTAINVLCNQKKLAFASKTPGRTQHINYFSIGGAHVGQHRKDETRVDEIRGLLVDLPGYGYAEVSGNAKLHWQRCWATMCSARATGRAGADRRFSRRPFTDLDVQMLEWFAPTGKPSIASCPRPTSSTATTPPTPCARRSTLLSSYVDGDGSPLPVHGAVVFRLEAHRPGRSHRPH